MRKRIVSGICVALGVGFVAWMIQEGDSSPPRARSVVPPDEPASVEVPSDVAPVTATPAELRALAAAGLSPDDLPASPAAGTNGPDSQKALFVGMDAGVGRSADRASTPEADRASLERKFEHGDYDADATRNTRVMLEDMLKGAELQPEALTGLECTAQLCRMELRLPNLERAMALQSVVTGGLEGLHYFREAPATDADELGVLVFASR